MTFFHRHRWLTPYLLLAPGLAWLVVFFVVPMYYLAHVAADAGSIDFGYTFTWAWHNYSRRDHDVPRRSSSARSSTRGSRR